MEVQYGIATKNKFDLFYDEDVDVSEILTASEQAKKSEEKGAKGKKDSKDSKSVKNKQNKKVLTPVQEQKGRQVDQGSSNRDVTEKTDRPKSRRQGDQNTDRPNRPPRDRENRDVPPRRERREPRNDRENRIDRPPTAEGGGGGFRDNNAERGEFRGRGRGRGARGGGRGRGGFDRFGKREFERHSGSDKSGVKAVDKREGSGSHNWGNFKDDIEQGFNESNVSEENPDLSVNQPDDTKPADDGEKAPETDVPEVPAEPEEEEVKEMTLEEYKAQQVKARPRAEFNIRRPGEGCDDSQWKKMYVLKKKEKEESDETDEEEYEEHPRRRANQLDIQIKFNDNSRMSRGGGRRGRGAPRGRGEGGFRDEQRGGFRGDREGGFRGDREGGFRGDREGGFRGDREGGFRGDREGGDREGGDREGGFRGGREGGFRGGREGGFRGERGGFRGDRGGFRGDRGRGRGARGGPRGEYSERREPAPNVIDESEFPSLVKTSA